ncbi:DEKNAAC100386 [Brettanomyces naardenensis]|uniref:DEKNAAC100386 n=1 Tax=Brettanomyces naardenensis TaxID=13370 RepID=A0A448YFZ6_BRENA|nr:DEKNAAC100386 [Brettanomyces naardenensis]
MLNLFIAAQLDGVTELRPTDTDEDPFEYYFKIQCARCREVHPKAISVNRLERHQIAGSRGEANFVFKCSFCGSSSNIDLGIPKKFKPYTVDDNGRRVPFLAVEARGVDIIQFIPEGPFECKGANSRTVFHEVDISGGEWYDYDEEAGNEVSITEIAWDISKK